MAQERGENLGAELPPNLGTPTNELSLCGIKMAKHLLWPEVFETAPQAAADLNLPPKTATELWVPLGQYKPWLHWQAVPKLTRQGCQGETRTPQAEDTRGDIISSTVPREQQCVSIRAHLQGRGSAWCPWLVWPSTSTPT